MIFNKKMLGSCCVGLALLLSSEGFGMQREYTLAQGGNVVRITSAEIRTGIERFFALRNAAMLRAELSSYWEVFISAYLVAQRGIQVGGITKSTRVEEIVEMDGYDVYCHLSDILGGEDLFRAVYEGGEAMD